MNFKHEVEANRMEIFQELGKRDGFFTRPDGGVVCPYCYMDFASTMKTEVLMDVLRERKKGGALAPWE